MNRVHDLNGDWFTMPPYDFSTTEPKMSGPKPRQRLTIPPAVGDVIANTRTCRMCSALNETGRCGWADPPFLRVAEVRPAVTGRHRGGWVIRVEPVPGEMLTLEDYAPPTGRPLNQATP